MFQEDLEERTEDVHTMTSGIVVHPLAEPPTLYKAPLALAAPADSVALVMSSILTFTLEGSGLMLLWIPVVHTICMAMGKQDPHIGNILTAQASMAYSLLFVGKKRSRFRIRRADGSWTWVRSRVFRTT